MRVQSNKSAKNGGWIHRTGDVHPQYQPPQPKPEPAINPTAAWNIWRKATSPAQIKTHAVTLGVEPFALDLLGAAWAAPYGAWAFPMRNASSAIIGIRFRSERGDKWALRGSHQGLFIPSAAFPKGEMLAVVEGPTDAAAALTLGLCAVGRPSCLGCEDELLQFIAASHVHKVLLVSDNDTPGINGATKLQRRLKCPSCFWIPPTKDLRAFVMAGGDTETLKSCVKDLIWTNPNPT